MAGYNMMQCNAMQCNATIGLTVGLVSIEPLSLRVVLSTESEDMMTDDERRELDTEKLYARKLLPLVSRHHLLLVTLLLMNSIANETLPLALYRLVPEYVTTNCHCHCHCHCHVSSTSSFISSSLSLSLCVMSN